MNHVASLLVGREPVEPPPDPGVDLGIQIVGQGLKEVALPLRTSGADPDPTTIFMHVTPH
jgi:hypothetical protein